MKKFAVRVTAYILAFVMIAILPCILLDPYSVFHPLHVRDNGVEPNKNYTKMVYIKKNPDKFDSFIFGSSLAGMVNPENIPGCTCYNMTHSGGVIPEFEANLKTLLKAGIIPQKLLIGLENGCYTDTRENRNGDRMRVSYEYSRTNPLDFWGLYIDPAVNIDALKTVISSNTISAEEKEAFTRVFYENGGYPYYGFSWNFDREEAAADLAASKERFRTAAAEDGFSQEHHLFMDEALSSMREIAALCEENGIELTVFVCPIYFETFENAALHTGFFEFLEELAEITPYYNFSGYNRYTEDPASYHEDRSHFLVELGDVMIDAMFNGQCEEALTEQGFGVYVTEENVGQVLGILKNA